MKHEYNSRFWRDQPRIRQKQIRDIDKRFLKKPRLILRDYPRPGLWVQKASFCKCGNCGAQDIHWVRAASLLEQSGRFNAREENCVRQCWVCGWWKTMVSLAGNDLKFEVRTL